MAKTHQPAASVRKHVSVMIRPNKHVTNRRETTPTHVGITPQAGDIW